MAKKIVSILMLSVIILLSSIILPLSTLAFLPQLTVIEWSIELSNGKVTIYAISSEDDSMSNPDYKLLPYHWYTTAKYYVNPSNKYGFSVSDVVNAIKASAEAWDSQTSAQVFNYMGTTSRSAGRYDGYNVISWGRYRAGVIAVTYIWQVGGRIVETDTRLNTYYKWSLNGEAGKMDVQNIMTHEFGHWCGLDDLYDDKDYWLTMYGYADFGETYKRTLGYGDILGLQAVYGA
ncbi:MAG: hypothetical protein H5T50_01430 [Nitrososphaeria archaeon]|nr:hypothetical protein [Nitrososphaeria archaeon]